MPVPHTDDFWQYALFAAVAYIRAAANLAGDFVRGKWDLASKAMAGMPVRTAMPPSPVPWPPSAITASSGAGKTAVPDG